MAGDPTPEFQASPGRDVFISYASHDKAVADAACEALESAGAACWIAPRNVTPGEFYAESIVHAIDSAKVIVVVLSQYGAASQHVLREVERASSKRHPVVSFRIDAAPLPAGLEYFLNSSQWLDASAAGCNRALPRLVEAVKIALAQDTAATRPRPTPSAVTKTNARPRRILVALAVVIAAVFAYATINKFWPMKRVNDQKSLAAVTPASLANPTAVVAISDKSIAVLPFTDMSEKKDQEYFVDGMAEEIIDLLAKIPGLKVIGRTSSFEFKGHNEDLRSIGTKLGTAFVVEGSVRKVGDQVRITAKLINTQTGTLEWSETYDRQVGDVLKLQDAIAAAVVREMQLTVGPGHLKSRTALKSADAYDLMLRGRHSADRWDKDGLDEAILLLNQALDLDPTYADAAAELAYTYQKQGETGDMLPTPASEQCRRAAERAVRLDPKNALGHVVLGRVHLSYDWDWAAADREFQYVATLAPGNADALHGKALLSITFGRWAEALTQTKAALALDPLDPKTFFTLAEIQFRRGHLAEAEAAARRALEIRPTFPWAHWMIGIVTLWRGDRDGALLEIQKEPTDDGKQIGLAMVYHALGKRADSDAALARMIKEQADGNAYGIAEVYAYRGQYDEAMQWLERAYTQRDPFLFYVKAEIAPTMPANDPRFKAFLHKMNLPE